MKTVIHPYKEISLNAALSCPHTVRTVLST